MILQSLCAYYKQLEDANTPDLPKLGYEAKEIPFTLVIDSSGNFVDLQDNRYEENKKKLCRKFVVPQSQIRSGSASYKISNYLWDHYGYVLGQAKKGKSAAEQKKNDLMAQRQFQAFCEKTREIADETHDPEVIAAVKFLTNPQSLANVKQSPNYAELLKINGGNVAFKLVGKEQLICQNEAVQRYCDSHSSSSEEKTGICLVSGRRGPISRLHLPISGICSQPAPLSSINDDAYCSYGQTQGYNFPVSPLADFQSSKALDYLLRKGSPNKIFWSGSSTTLVFWADKATAGSEDIFGFIRNDDTRNAADVVKSLYSSVHNGVYVNPDQYVQVYMLGLQPNAKRIAVKFWHTGTVGDISVSLVRWLDDICLQADSDERSPLNAILRSIVNPNIKNDSARYEALYENTLHAILQGTPLPAQLISNALLRVRAEQGNVTPHRAAVIKAYLTRRYRLAGKEELTMSLNLQETRPGYLLGRLMAVFEKLQKDVSPGLNTTVRDRYFASASVSPKTVFTTLIRLHVYHLQKLDSPGRAVFYSDLIGEIMDKVSEIPSHMDLENQGLFCLGYYQQQKALYTKKEN